MAHPTVHHLAFEQRDALQILALLAAALPALFIGLALGVVLLFAVADLIV